jgi:MFS family permease
MKDSEVVLPLEDISQSPDMIISSQINTELDDNAIKKLIRKMDFRLIPYLSILYLFSFLDRVNIGYARIYRMEEELNLNQSQYSWSLSVFFIGYVLFEVPSNLILKKATPPRWISRIMVTWGGITMAMAAVKNFQGLIACRFFLGLSEAGLFPGIIYFLSFWYTRKEQGLRIALFYSAASLAGAFSGLLAYGISYIDGKGGLSGWQWIFIIEGLPSVLVGIATWWLLPSTPNNAKWLNDSERDFLSQRLLKDHTDSETKAFRKEQLIEAFKDYKVYLYMLLYFGFNCPFYSMATLLPTIINGMGFSKLTSLLLSAPPYAIGVFTIIGMAYHSDKKMERCFHLCISIGAAALGFIIMVVVKEDHNKYYGVILVIAGIATSTPITLSWLNNNMLGSTKSGAASAMVVSFGNLGGVIAGQLYRNTEAPVYLTSHAINIGFMLFALIIALTLRFCLKWENDKLNRLVAEEDSKIEPRADGLDVRDFRFTL